jgi:hypothetical protein
MSAGGIAALIAATALILFVLFLAVPLLKLGQMIDSATRRVEQSSKIIDEAVARIQQTGETVDAVNDNLAHVEKVATNVENISSNLAALVGLFGATLGGPTVRIAAFSYGVRKALRKRRVAELEDALKAIRKAQKATTKAARKAVGS